MKILILDDEVRRHNGLKKFLVGHDLTHSFTCADAVAALNQEYHHAAFLDHDLHDIQDGRDFCKWATSNPEKAPRKIFIHSWNGWRADEMRDQLLKLPFKTQIIVRPIPAISEDPPESWALPNNNLERLELTERVTIFTALINGLLES